MSYKFHSSFFHPVQPLLLMFFDHLISAWISCHVYCPPSIIRTCRLSISHNKVEMKAFIVCLILVTLGSCLPYVEQMLLANSMIVGRDDLDDLANWDCNVCDSTNRPLHAHYIEESEKDIKCVLAVYPQFIVLAFRYTNTLLNVWQDILYANQVVDSSICSNCKVQKAYKKMWETIVANVTNDLVAIRKQTGLKKLYITGISLGGGLSVISFADINKSKIFDDVQVINYGSPRVANKNYADYFDNITQKRSKRFVVKGDPIPVMPECLTPLCNYKHTGNQYVCVNEQEICRGGQAVPELFFEGLEWTTMNVDPDEQNLGSIVDHIYGYKKIYNYTVIEH